ncbi:helix-turn-helix domain-containing protein [Cytobacillus firmus]|nr:helix-turn-helix domain-containing protein [Cytobacillus firmus]
MDGSIGTKLRALRLKQKLSQREVAKTTGLSRFTISCLERNKHFPHRKNLLKLAKFYGVSVKELTK